MSVMLSYAPAEASNDHSWCFPKLHYIGYQARMSIGSVYKYNPFWQTETWTDGQTEAYVLYSKTGCNQG